mgnify:CR=1 FL=1
MESIQEIQEEIVDDFALFEDWMGKYNHLIDLGKDLPEIDDAYKTDDHLIKGCQSRVWLHADMKGEKIHFSADSDAIITKGIISLLIRPLNHRSPDEILNADMGFVDEIGLKEHLSPTRANGLVSMIKQMKTYALAFKAKSL